MAPALLRSIRWLKNHGVMLVFSDGQRYVPPDGALTHGQATRLLGVSQMHLYRLHAAGALKFRRGKTAMVPLSELRRLRRERGAQCR